VDDIYTEPWIYWAQAAARHLQQTRDLRAEATSGLPIGSQLVRLTLDELPAAMQSIVSAAFAIDGFEGALSQELGLSPAGRPRADALFSRLDSLFEIPSGRRAAYRTEVRWLFAIRNETVHADVRKDPPWQHPSGVSVSAVQRDLGLESAERALEICERLLRTCLSAPKPGARLDDWVNLRRAKFDLALQG
jgi:hypothetical protein